MGSGNITKVMKYELRYLDGCGSFSDMQQELWGLQKKTREILNRTIQYAYHWDFQNREHLAKTGKPLDILEKTRYKSLDGYIYNCLIDQYKNMSSSNVNATIQKAWKRYKKFKVDVLRGTMSVPSYKSDQPIIINKDCVKLYREESVCIAELTLFSKEYKTTFKDKTNVRFTLSLNDNTQRTIVERLLSKEYKLGECQLVYKRPKWFLYLTYSFQPIQHALDSQRILGVDLGESIALCASSICENTAPMKLPGGEITAFAKELEARKRSLQKQAAHCGEGRIGHGTKTRVSDVYKMENRIANFRSTINHRYSKALIDYAVKHQYGTIQMEDLSGIKSDTGFPKFLQHWTYYDLQAKIEAKAKEYGIKVVKVDPRYTSQRCSRCGHICKENRPNQAQFSCVNCGYKENADFNASQNLSIKGIDKIIKKELGANQEQTKEP